MSHMIDETNGKASCLVAGGNPAWHGLGVHVSDAVKWADAIKLANLDWNVIQREVLVAQPFTNDDGTTELKLAPYGDNRVNVRSDTNAILGMVTDRYHILQNREAGDFLDSLFDEGTAKFDTAGATHEGKRIFASIRLNKQYSYGTADPFDVYMMLSNWHDGKGSLEVLPTSVRVVCNNTATLAIKQDGRKGFTIKHFRTMKQKMEEAKRSLVLTEKACDLHVEQAHHLQKVRMKKDQFEVFVKEVFKIGETEVAAPENEVQPIIQVGGSILDAILDADIQRKELGELLVASHKEESNRKKNRDRELLSSILNNWEHPANNLAGAEETAWTAYNAISQYVDHQQSYRGKTAYDRAENRFNQIMDGKAETIKASAWNKALALT